MPSSPKILGQAFTAAAATALYTAPANTSAVASTLTLCNTGTTASYATVRVAKAGAVDAASQTVYDQVEIPPHETFGATIGITLAPSDALRVFATTTLVVATLFGTEVS